MGLTYKGVENFEFTLFSALQSGAKGGGSKKTAYNATLDAAFGDTPDGRMFLVGGSDITTSGGMDPRLFDISGANHGLFVIGLSGKTQMDKFSIFAQYGFVMNAIEYLPKTKAIIGNEIDVEVGYEIAKNTSLFVQGAFLFTDSDFADKNQAYAAWGLKTSL